MAVGSEWGCPVCPCRLEAKQEVWAYRRCQKVESHLPREKSTHTHLLQQHSATGPDQYSNPHDSLYRIPLVQPVDLDPVLPAALWMGFHASRSVTVSHQLPSLSLFQLPLFHPLDWASGSLGPSPSSAG